MRGGGCNNDCTKDFLLKYPGMIDTCKGCVSDPGLLTEDQKSRVKREIEKAEATMAERAAAAREKKVGEAAKAARREVERATAAVREAARAVAEATAKVVAARDEAAERVGKGWEAVEGTEAKWDMTADQVEALTKAKETYSEWEAADAGMAAAEAVAEEAREAAAALKKSAEAVRVEVRAAAARVREAVAEDWEQ